MANYFDLEDFVFAFILVGQERKKERNDTRVHFHF